MRLSLPSAATATALTLRLGYRGDRLSLPTGDVRKRITGLPADAFVTAVGLGYAGRVVIARSAGLTQNPLLHIELDRCKGKHTAGGGDVSCLVEGCASGNGAIEGCLCSVDEH